MKRTIQPLESFDTLPAFLQRIVPLIARGASNTEIATELGLAKHTVENYVSTIMAITDSMDRPKLLLASATWLARAG